MDVARDAGVAGGGETIAPVVMPGEPLTLADAAARQAERRAAENKPSSEASEAARKLSQAGWEKRRQAQAVEQPAPVEQQELPAQGDDSPVDPVPVEAEAPDPAELPPIEPPRSWTKEHKDAFAALPRDIQERVSEVERSREAEFLRRQQDAAEKLKGLTAKEQAAEQVRQQYEAALPQVLAFVQQQGAEFADIKTMADVQRVAAEDPARYIRWQAHQQQLNAVATEMQGAEQRSREELSKRWADFSAEQDRLISEKVPELADPAHAPKLRESAASALRDYGFADEELGRLYNGQLGLSLRDHRIQLAILDAVKWRDAQQAKAKIAAVPKPPVQRPGTAPSKGAQVDQQVSALRAKLPTLRGLEGVRVAAEIRRLERQKAR
jgi:hypothetical protein